jgi:hypothetical protein
MDELSAFAGIPDLVHACLDLLIDGEHGIWHLASDGMVTRVANWRGCWLASRESRGGRPAGRLPWSVTVCVATRRSWH